MQSAMSSANQIKQKSIKEKQSQNFRNIKFETLN